MVEFSLFFGREDSFRHELSLAASAPGTRARGRRAAGGRASSVQLPARRVVRDDRRHSRSLAELLTEPSPLFRVFDLLKSKPNCLAKNLSDALLGRALCAVMRDAPAELRQYRL